MNNIEINRNEINNTEPNNINNVNNINNLSNVSQMIKFTFVGKNTETINALKKHFGDLLNIDIIKCDISQIPFADCIVSPGNSYGLMDGGVDRTINYMLDGISDRVQNVIENVYYGEQPVGSCLLLKTYNQKYKYLAHCPTIRIPETTNNNLNPYIAFRSLLATIFNHNRVADENDKIKTVLCTAFCTGAGGMDNNEAARLMRVAYTLTDLKLSCSWKNAKMIDSYLK